MKKTILFAIGILISTMLFAQHLKKDGTPDRRYKENKYYSAPTYTPKPKYTAPTSSGIQRDANGRIKRSSSERLTFMKHTGYAHGRPGYVVDHIKPLKEGGCDCPENMQWQTIAEGKAKDKLE